MTTLSAHVPKSTQRVLKTDVVDYEPDEEWKCSMRKRIEEGLESMVKEVKDNQHAELKRGVISQERRMRMEEEYKTAMSNIKALANEQYQVELQRERHQRKWLAGLPINAEWSRALVEEQQSIMNTIKQTTNSDDRPPTESPTEDRRPPQFTRSNGAGTAAPLEASRSSRSVSNQTPSTPKPSLDTGDKPASTPIEPPPSTRRGSDARNTISRDREDRPTSLRRESNATPSRQSLPEQWATQDAGEESEEMLRPPPSRSRPSFDQPSSSPEAGRWESSLSRNGSLRAASGYSARSPPKPLPEVWKPSTTPSDDPPAPFPPIPPPNNKSHTHLGRRGSSASMRSTGSGSSGRPTIAETIPERADDDGEGASDSAVADDFDQPRPKHADQERRGGRKTSRPLQVDPTLNSEEPPSMSSTTTTTLRSGQIHPSSMVMQLATSPAPTRSLSTKPSFPNGENDRYREAPPSTAPIREREPAYTHRDPPYSARDPPPSRPLPPRNPYGEDKEYGPYQTPSRGAKTYREYPPTLAPSHPVSHKSSFNYEDRRRDRERPREPDRERDRERGESWDETRGDYGRDREYDYRDREWDRDRDREPYREPRYPNNYPPYTARSPGYPTPPSSSARHMSQEYVQMNDIYDNHDGPPGPRYRPDDWEYARPESARPVMTRQNSYSRRDDTDRDPYSRGYPNSSGAPMPPRHQPSREDLALGPGWKDWGSENRRAAEPRYDNYARSPPPQDHFPVRRRSTANYHSDPSTRDEPPSRTRRKHTRRDDDDDRNDIDDDHDHDRDRRVDERRRQDEVDTDSDDSSDEEEREREEQAKKLEAERRETDERIKEQAAEIQRLQEEEKRLEEEARKKEEEVRLKEEEVKRKEEEAERISEELRKKDEEMKRKAEEARKKEEGVRRKEKEAQRKEQEAKRKAEDAKRIVSEARAKAEEANKKEEEARRKEEEVNMKEERARRQEEKLKEDAERTRRLQQEANRIAEETKKKQEVLRKLEAETKRKEQEIEERERALEVREEGLRQREEGARRLEEEAWKKEEDARKKEADARRKEQEARRKEEEVRRKEEEARKKEEEARRKEQEARRKEEEVRRKEEEARKKEEEAMRKEQEARRKEEEVRRREEEARKKEEEAMRKEQEAKRKEEARRKEEEIKRKEAEARRKEEEVKRKEFEARRRKEEAWRKEEEDRRRVELMQEEEEARRIEEEELRAEEEERKRQDEEEFRAREERIRREQEARRFQETEVLLDQPIDSRFIEEQSRLLQQAEFRKREEEIRRRTEERKRQDSVGHENAWIPPPPQTTNPRSSYNQFPSAQPQYSAPSPSPSGSSAAWTTWGAGPTKSSTMPTPTTAPTSARTSSSTIPPPNTKPRAGSVSGGSYPNGASPQSSTPFSESEWARRHAEFTNGQQERFRREQERLEAERQMRAAGRPLSRDDVQKVFEHHDRLWSRLPSISDLQWQDFPWPVLRPPSSPDDITFPLVNAYFQSPFAAEKDKFKSAKDRIKDHLRRWHPDRFDSKVLPRVVDSEKDKIKQGAGSVVRYLNDLLRKENESGSASNLFGE